MPKAEPLLTDKDYDAIFHAHRTESKSVGLCTDPEHTGMECLQSAVPGLAADISRLAEALHAVLSYGRVRVIGGFMRGRCVACNVPHLFWRKCPCPHHEAEELLKELGVEI